MEAFKKFCTIPELGEALISYLDPLSTLHLAQSSLMEKKILQKSLTSKAWSQLIRRSSLANTDCQAGWVGFMSKKDDVKVFVKILHFVERGELSRLLMPLLDLISESSPGHSAPAAQRASFHLP